MSEESEIKRDGAKAQKNSGRGKHEKGDARLGPFVYDIKEYTKSFSVSVKNWVKVSTDAFKSGGKPAFKLVLEDNGTTVRVFVVEERMFHEMLEAWQEKYEPED